MSLLAFVKILSLGRRRFRSMDPSSATPAHDDQEFPMRSRRGLVEHDEAFVVGLRRRSL